MMREVFKDGIVTNVNIGNSSRNKNQMGSLKLKHNSSTKRLTYI